MDPIGCDEALRGETGSLWRALKKTVVSFSLSFNRVSLAAMLRVDWKRTKVKAGRPR